MSYYGLGVGKDNVSIRVLQQKDEWKSFVATVPQVNEQVNQHGLKILLCDPFMKNQMDPMNHKHKSGPFVSMLGVEARSRTLGINTNSRIPARITTNNVDKANYPKAPDTSTGSMATPGIMDTTTGESHIRNPVTPETQ